MTVLLYGCECWVLSVNIENKINVFATSCYRIMLSVKRLYCVSNAILHVTNNQPLINTAGERQLRFLGYILRLPDDKLCRRYALDLLCQPMTEGDRGDRGQLQATYRTSRSCWGIQKTICIQMQMPC